MHVELLTNSRMSAMKSCLRKAYYSYELGLRKDRDSQPLRMGEAIHIGLDWRAKGEPLERAILEATKGYILVPQWAEPFEWDLEREIVARLLAGYYWQYSDDAIEIVASEIPFDLAIFNPDTHMPSRNFRTAGVIDKIVKLPDGRLAIMEHKTTGDDLSDGSDYWPRLRLDQQISLYVLAARALGYDVETVLYDVIRKPSIRPKLITKEGFKELRFTGKYCKEPVETEGLQVGMTETVQMFGSRLLADIGERPDFYFRRREVPRMEMDLQEFEGELWHYQKLLRECQVNGRWPRNSNSCLIPWRCEFADVCFNGLKPEKEVPSGYKIVTNVNPELERSSHVLSTNGCQTAASEASDEATVSTADCNGRS